MAHPRAGGGYGCSGWARGQGECDSLGMRTLSMWRAGDAGLGSERVAAHSTRHGAARVYSERAGGGLESRLVLLDSGTATDGLVGVSGGAGARRCPRLALARRSHACSLGRTFATLARCFWKSRSRLRSLRASWAAVFCLILLCWRVESETHNIHMTTKVGYSRG